MSDNSGTRNRDLVGGSLLGNGYFSNVSQSSAAPAESRTKEYTASGNMAWNYGGGKGGANAVDGELIKLPMPTPVWPASSTTTGGGTTATPTFDSYLKNITDLFSKQTNDFSGVAKNYTDQYNALLPKLDTFVNDFRNVASSSSNDFNELFRQLQSSYGNITGDYTKQLAVRQQAQDALNKLSADVINNMASAQKSVTTGNVDAATASYLDALYGSQKNSIISKASTDLDSIRNNVYSNMVQRGLLSPSAMGTLMAQSTRDAQAALRSQLASLDTQKAQALVDAPYKQFEVARNMLSGVETQRGVEQAARDFLSNYTNQLYGAAFNNAQQSANILGNKYTQQYAGLSNAANTAVQPTLLAGQQYTNYQNTLKAYLDAMAQTNISKYNADVNERIAKLNAAIQQQQVDNSGSTDWGGIIGGLIGGLF